MTKLIEFLGLKKNKRILERGLTSILGIFIVLFLFIFSKAYALDLIENGSVESIIVTPNSASDEELEAASELQDYFAKMTGQTLEIIIESQPYSKIPIYIGITNAAVARGLTTQVSTLKDDSYIIEVTSNAVYLIGKDPLATRYAVCGLLEDRFGVRWFLPGDIGEVVPQTDTISLDIGIDRKEPSFIMREVGHGSTWSLHNRMSRTVNSIFGLHFYYSQEELQRVPVHSFQFLVPPEEYFISHPEYFGLVDGERVDRQLETANPELIQVISDNAVKELATRPELDIMILFPNDGLGFSESPESKLLDEPDYPYTVEDINEQWRLLDQEKYGILSRRMTIFYNEVATNILNYYPDKYVMCGAYSAYRTPPEDIGITMPENTIVEFTRNTGHNLSLEDGGVNSIYTQSIDGWRDIYPLFSIYEYYWKAAANGLPYPVIHSMRNDIPYYYNKGDCFGLYTQHSSANVGTLGLSYYIAAKLLWDVNADVDVLLDDFYHKFYGPAWQPMKLYYEALEQTILDNSDIELPVTFYEKYLIIFNDYLLSNLASYLSHARTLAIGHSTILDRIEMTEISYNYLNMAMAYVKELQNVINVFGWAIRTTPGVLDNAQAMADAIWQYLDDNFSKNVVRLYNLEGDENKYIKNFLTPTNAVKKIKEYNLDKMLLDKTKWINDPTVLKGLNDSRIFDLWIYGYDFDSSVLSEHAVYLVDINNNEIQVGELAPIGRSKNKVNYAFVIKDIDSDQFVLNDGTLKLRIENYPGSWTGSSINAVYVMSHDANITDDQATQRIENFNERKNLHRDSFGFVEYWFNGIANGDGEKLEINIDLYDSSPMVHLKLDEISGSNIAVDSSGNGNDGTLIGDTTWTTGKVGLGALEFYGDNDYVELGDKASLNLTNAITICAWIKPAVVDSRHALIVDNRGGRVGSWYKYGYLLSFLGDKILFQMGTGTEYYGKSSYTYNFTVGQWYHVAVTYDGTNTNFYIEGGPNRSYTNGIGNIAHDGDSFRISAAGTRSFNGALDQVKVFDYALTPEEILDEYNEADSGLAGQWKLDNDAKDSSGNGNDGTLIGDTTWTTGKVGLGALEFYGDNDYVELGDKTSLNLTNAITICAWIKPAVVDSRHALIVDNRGGRVGSWYKYGYLLSFLGDKILFQMGTGTEYYGKSSYTYNFTVGQWYHVAVTYDGTNTNFYIEGGPNRSYTNGIGNIAHDGDSFRISAARTRSFNGAIDQVKVFDYALTPEEILDEYKNLDG